MGMTFFDQMKQVATRVKEHRSDAQNEAQTISYLVYPFLKDVLGYDYASPKEVVREFGADIAGKKGEKVDIALLGEDGTPIILIEVKACTNPLGDDPLVQLKRYFPHTPARVGILTNGLVYKFYSEKSDNKANLDSEPFLEVDVLKYAQNTALEDDTIKKLQKFRKKNFNVEDILSTAEDLKYINAMKEFFKRQLDTPEEEFVKVVLRGLPFDTTKRNKVEKYGSHVKQALSEVIGERVAKRIAAAGDLERGQLTETAEVQNEEKIAESSSEILPTEEELACYYIVKAILAKTVDLSRIAHKKGKTGFSIQLDGSIKKLICRFTIAPRSRFVEIPEAEKWARHDFQDVNEAYELNEKIIERTQALLG